MSGFLYFLYLNIVYILSCFFHPFIYPQTLGCFHILFIVNNEMKMGVETFLHHSDFITYRYIPVLGLVDHMTILFSFFFKKLHTSFP
jgi:hypothetical protein